MKRKQSDSLEESSEEETPDYLIRVNTQSRWWWFTVNFKTQEEAINWNPPDMPRVKYALYRAHVSPKTGQPHVHCLANYETPVKYSTLKNMKYGWLFHCTLKEDRIIKRNYIINDYHRNRRRTPKGVISDPVEIGVFKNKSK